MKTILLASAAIAGILSSQALAADLPPRPAPPPPPIVIPVFSWTGIYTGGNLGGAWAQGDISTDLGYTWSRSSTQFIGGGQIGFNYQAGIFVVGVEGDFDWTSGKKSSAFVDTVAFGPVEAVGNWNWLATVAARLGLAWDRALFYGKVGYGWSKTSVDLQTAAGDTICCSWSNTNSGLLLGAGIEYAFANNWTAKIEYNFLDLQKRTATVDGLNVVTADPQIHMVKAGFNFKFGGGAY